MLRPICGLSAMRCARSMKKRRQLHPLASSVFARAVDLDKFGAPDTIRTCDLCLRRATLYPAELRVRCGSFSRLPCYRQCPCGAGVGSVGRCVPSLRQRSHVRIVSGAPGHACRACRDCGGSISPDEFAEHGSFRPRGISSVQISHALG
jgi:hypothetical protein